MKRNINLEEISDGKLYHENDMAKLGCNDCKGCSACCQGMGSSIVLDPLDVFRLTEYLGKGFQELLEECLELNVVDGVILPNLRMTGEKEACAFLNEEGRCAVHTARPGICRLFPLGRYYENGDFSYFLQTKECRKENRTKVKISKWIDTSAGKKNHDFIVRWHYFLNAVEQAVLQSQEDEVRKQINLLVLHTFFLTPYDTARDFYEQFAERMVSIEAILLEEA